MSNAELDPLETVCTNGRRAEGGAAGGLGSISPRFVDGLSDGVHHVEGSGVDLLEPRDVPLGGPRAMTVKRILPQRARSLIGAWCFLDFYGPDDVAATGGMAVPRHPHTGLATVSWLFTGQVDHLDSAGNWATVRPGEVNLMNAGVGITHQEFSTAATTVLHGAQLWYAFPEHARFSAPSLESHRPEPVEGEGSTARVFLGSALGQTSPVATHIPLTGIELTLDPGASLTIDVPADHEHGLLRVSGAVSLEGVEVPEDQLAYVGTGHRRLTVRAGDEPVLALLIGGEPLDEEIIMWWNFVGRTHDDIVAFRARYQAEMGFEDEHERNGEDEEPIDTEDPGPLQFGDYPPGQPAPIPAPALPTSRLRPRANPSRTS